MGELSAAQHREQMAQMAEEARRLDGQRAVQGGQPQAVAQQPKRDEEGEGPAGGGDSVAERLASSGVSQSMLMDIMERMEAMAGSEQGPIQAMKSKNATLLAKVEELEAAKARWIRHAEELEAASSRQEQALVLVQALQEEVQRKAAHSEHLEFLAQQYSDQVASSWSSRHVRHGRS